MSESASRPSREGVVALVVFAAVLAFAFHGCGSGSTSSGHAAKTPKPVGGKEKVEVQTVAAEVALIQQAITEASKNATPDSVNQLAQAAQQAHDDFGEAKDNFASDAPTNDQTAAVFGAMDDLRHAMGALVTYTGNPNPATLASFTTQWQRAVGEWNDAVTALWVNNPDPAPTIATSS